MYQPSLREIPVDKIQRAKYQPRQIFDPTALAELAESIKSSGLIQPIVVRPVADFYEIVAGERRWRASQLAGMQNITCIVKNYTDEQAAAVSTIENVNRIDLNAIEEAKAYQRLIDEFHYVHEEVAAVIGKSRASVTNSLRLLQLDVRVQQLLIDKKLSEGHGKCLAGLTAVMQYKVALSCVEKGWSVRKLEQEIKKIQQPTATIHAEDPNLIEFERLVSEQLGAQVKLDPDLSERSGWLKIRYFNNETLAGVLDKMGIKYE